MAWWWPLSKVETIYGLKKLLSDFVLVLTEKFYGYMLYCLLSEDFPVHSIKAYRGKSKGKIHPITGHEGPEGE
jgi:hypothetical protein